MNDLISTKTMEARIEEAFNAAIECRSGMDEAREDMLVEEEEVKLRPENTEEFSNAKNGQVRELLLASWMLENDKWREARAKYRNYRNDYKLALLEIERLKLLVQTRWT